MLLNSKWQRGELKERVEHADVESSGRDEIEISDL